jgi:thiamine-phosphate pyrophosphorylase
LIRCLISDGTWVGDHARWLDRAAAWLDRGVEIFQIRERELSVRDLAALTRQVLRLPNPHETKIIVNDRADVAIACGAHGVHLRDGSVLPEVFARPGFLVTVACHEVADAMRVRGANFVLLAPIFKPLSKTDSRPVLGPKAIEEFTRLSDVPVLALGGITPANARLCMEAGAAGVAGISYFYSIQ